MEKTRNELILPELYFLIQKFLSDSPLQDTYKVLCNEIETNKILPNRIDWEGNSHDRNFQDLERLYPHIGNDHLLQICNRIGPILDKEIPPSLKGVASLLGSGRQSLLRTNESVLIRRATLLYYATRLHRMPITADHRTTHNIVNVIFGRETSGPCPRSLLMPCERYGQLKLHRQTLGHLSSVYCLIFDHTGRYIATGADDLLIKLWSCTTGRLLASFRGATGEITDIDINTENNLLAAGSMDRILRVWNLQTGAPVAILTCHTGMITSVNFCPSSMWEVRYLVTTSTDGSVAFWTYNHDARNNVHFVSKPVLFHEKMRPGQAQMICSVFSPGGAFLVAGSADHNVRVYLLRGDEGPVRILETEVHTDRVDSLSWAHRGLRFMSGSKDGTAHIWHFETQQWKSKKLDMATKLPGHKSEDDEPKKPTRVTMVAWDPSDTFVITAVSDYTLKVWFSNTGQLHMDLLHHKNEIYVLESHPTDPYIILSAGHDGLICVWNVLTGKRLVEFKNHVEGQGVGEVYDVKWSPDGSHVAASDAYGHILIFGFDCGDPRLKQLPKELFFHTDYRPLVHTPERAVLDEQTQMPPHLMPPPFLVDIDGNPYPPMLQRLVPGRENCTSEQLVPNIVLGTGGRQEVIEGLPDGEQPRSDIDRMIEDIARRHIGPDDAPRAPAVRQGHRRSGDVEGVRQSTGDWQSGSNIEWTKNTYIKSISPSEEEYFKEHVDFLCNLEMDEYKSEMKRRPIMITSTPQMSKLEKGRRRRPNGSQYTTTRRSMRTVTEEEEPEEQDPEESANDSSSHHSDYTSTQPDDISSDSSDESSGYSDWVADQGVTLQPPKRCKRKSAHRKINMSDTDDDNEEGEEALQDNDENTDQDEGDEDKSETGSKATKKGEKKSGATSVVVNGFAEPSTSKRKIPPPLKNVKKILKNGEIPELYKPSEWLAETVPRKAPYWPQMGDEVVYFIQGHQIYVESVKAKNIYSVNTKELPWTKHDLKDHEYVKIVGIKYEIRPPRLCCLKLALLDDDKKLTDKDFTIKYHDMADVLDFMVLSQTYDLAISRNWNTEDKFRCMIEDAWWMGKIVQKSALNEDYPDSLFSCYETQWDSGELERMSPWDMEAINDERLPDNLGEALPVLSSELQSLLYTPAQEEWPNGERDSSSTRIIGGLDYIMGLAIAEPFLAPVDLNIYPAYACIVEYPIDLTTIKVRLENRFYRRITSVQFDVRYLATNAEKFNKPHSCIVKFARIITEICLKLMSTTEDIELPTLYHQLMETYESSGSEEDNDANDANYNAHDDANSDEDIDVVNAGAGPSTRPSTSKMGLTMNGAHHSSHNGNSTTVLRSLRSARLKQNGAGPSGSSSATGGAANESDPEFACGAGGARNSKYSNDWRLEAKRLLEKLWASDDSVPFRAPVDHLKHPDYYQLIDTPMDLGSVKEDLFGGNYESPLDFAKDVRLVFTNSKHYNTNNRSRIYSMTSRLSVKFEKHIKLVLQIFRKAKRANVNPSKRGRTKRPPKRRRVKKPSVANNDTTTEDESLPDDEEDADEDDEETNDKSSDKNDENGKEQEKEESDVESDKTEPETKVQVDEEVNDQDVDDDDPLKNAPEEEEEEEDDELNIRLNGRKRLLSDSDGSSFSDSEKVPLSQGKVVASSVPSSDDSDSQPLSQLRGRNNKAHSSSHRRKGTLRNHSSSNEDSNHSLTLRSRRKRIKLDLTDSEEMTENSTSNNNSSDSDNSDSMPLNILRDRETSVTTQSQSSQNDDEDVSNGSIEQSVSNETDHNYGRPSKPIVSISSRGRIRKITERARALFR